MKTYTHFVGIDIAKNKADVAWHDGKKEQIANTPEGVEAFLASHAEVLKNALVVVEATGGYELLLIHMLVERGVAVHRVAPRTACHYRLSIKQRGKTDALDAVILARYGAERHAALPLFQRPTSTCERLAALQARRADLVGMRANEKKRLQQAREDWLKANIGTMIAHFDAHIQQLEQEIEALIAASPELQQKRACLQTIPGIGAKTAAPAGLISRTGAVEPSPNRQPGRRRPPSSGKRHPHRLSMHRRWPHHCPPSPIPSGHGRPKRQKRPFPSLLQTLGCSG